MLSEAVGFDWILFKLGRFIYYSGILWVVFCTIGYVSLVAITGATILYLGALSSYVKSLQLNSHIRHSRGPRSPALEEWMRADMGATRECCAGPHA